jgi:two-component system chemotaxis sensor kinase CheA
MEFLEEELEEILNIFREESEEHIQSINQNLLKLEKNSADSGVIAELFREAHSIKGSARMIGLNDIQNLAHHLEDIIGYAKDRTIKITPEIIDVLCRTVDCISSIIDESIKTKGSFHSTQVDKIIIEFEAIKKKFVEGIPEELPLPAPQKTPDKGENETTETCTIINSVNNVIPSLLEDLKKLITMPDNKNFISSFHEKINQIDILLESLENKKIKDNLFNIKSKLDWITKGSGILTNIEVSEIQENLENFVDSIKNISTNLSHKPTIIDKNPDKKSPEFRQKTEKPEQLIQPSTATKENQDDEIFGNSKIKSLSFNIDKLINPDNLENNCQELIDGINNIIETINNSHAKQILLKLVDIVSYVKESKSLLDKEILGVLKQSVNSIEVMLSAETSDEDPELLIQRLSILQQMLELSKENVFNPEDDSPSVQSTTIMMKNDDEKEGDSNQTTANYVESGAIKTLRVDTKKLDQLVSQVGELIVAKIKTKQHLLEIEKLSTTTEEWQRSWNKTKQYFKYADRKFGKELDYKQSAPFQAQQKNIFSIFEETSSKISELNNSITSIHRTIQEDDTRLNLVVNELEQMIKSVRVLPLATIFHMFPRMVRDISREKGKQIELIVSGSETSADKKIIEEIKSPLTHIIRNSIDHGVETPEERIQSGKNPTGTIFLSAYHLENSILIEIIDDGRGIDIEKIKNKVIKKGLLTHEELAAMSDNQIMNIIFWPGFSTGEVVTDISGRGVGLDVVHTKISQLNGKVKIKSKFGEGCKVSIQLPVTMATIKSFLVSINEQTFAIPTNSIKTAMSVKPEDIFYKEGQTAILVHNKTVPVFKLSKILEMNDDETIPDKYTVVVIQMEENQIGFIIDKLIGDHEILHKNLSPPLIRVRNIAGVTTLGTGELCLILNINDLIKSALTISGDTAANKAESLKYIEKRKQYSILVVDDSMTTRILERNILRSAGYNVSVAVNGLDALTKLNSEQFDLVVSDVEMPEMTGIELVKRIKGDKKYADLPVIIVTSLSSEKDKQISLDAGANAYITKGQFDQKELLATIKKCLK